MDLHLLNQFPDAWVSRDIGDSCVKCLIGLVKRLAISGSAGLALTFEDRTQAEDLAGGGALGGLSCRGFFKRLADDDGLRQRGKRNSRNEDAGLRKDFDQTLIR